MLGNMVRLQAALVLVLILQGVTLSGDFNITVVTNGTQSMPMWDVDDGLADGLLAFSFTRDGYVFTGQATLDETPESAVGTFDLTITREPGAGSIQQFDLSMSGLGVSGLSVGRLGATGSSSVPLDLGASSAAFGSVVSWGTLPVSGQPFDSFYPPVLLSAVGNALLRLTLPPSGIPEGETIQILGRLKFGEQLMFDDCGFALDISSMGGPFDFDLARATPDSSSSCEPTGSNSDAWFAYQPAEVGSLNLSAGPATTISVIENGCGGNEIACGVGSLVTGVLPGDDLLIRVSRADAGDLLLAPLGASAESLSLALSPQVGDFNISVRTNGMSTPSTVIGDDADGFIDGFLDFNFNDSNYLFTGQATLAGTPESAVGSFDMTITRLPGAGSIQEFALSMFGLGVGGLSVGRLGATGSSSVPLDLSASSSPSGPVVFWATLPVSGQPFESFYPPVLLSGVATGLLSLSFPAGIPAGATIQITGVLKFGEQLTFDGCGTALDLTGLSGPFDFDLARATPDSSASCEYPASEGDAWFAYQAPQQGTLALTSGPNVTISAIACGCGGTEVACGVGSLVTDVSSSDDVLIRVSRGDAASLLFDPLGSTSELLTLSLTPFTPPAPFPGVIVSVVDDSMDGHLVAALEAMGQPYTFALTGDPILVSGNNLAVLEDDLVAHLDAGGKVAVFGPGNELFAPLFWSKVGAVPLSPFSAAPVVSAWDASDPVWTTPNGLGALVPVAPASQLPILMRPTLAYGLGGGLPASYDNASLVVGADGAAVVFSPHLDWYCSIVGRRLVENVLYRLLDPPPRPPYLNGDCNQDTVISNADAVQILQSFVLGLPAPVPCRAACDVNDSGVVDVADAVYLFQWLYFGGPPPPPPAFFCDLGPMSYPVSCLGSVCP